MQPTTRGMVIFMGGKPQKIGLLATRNQYTDDGDWEKIHLYVKFKGELGKRSRSDKTFSEAREQLAQLINKVVEEYRAEGRKIDYLALTHSISVTEIKTQPLNFGEVVSALIKKLEAAYSLTLREEE